MGERNSERSGGAPREGSEGSTERWGRGTVREVGEHREKVVRGAPREGGGEH